MRLPDPQAVAAIIETVADEEILPRFGSLSRQDVREKGPGDLVTVVDERSEQRLGEALSALLPGSVIVGEEGAAHDPGILRRLHGPDPVWILDPLDGTRSFTNGHDRFTVLVALSHYGRTVAGWVYHPVSRVMAMAVDGEGAVLAGEPLSLAGSGEARPLSAMSGVFVIPRKAGWRRDATHRLAHRLKSQRRIEGAGVEYLDLLAGRTDVAFFYRLNPWDHAAGVFVHREAGGAGGLVDGRDYVPTIYEAPLLLTPDRESWAEAAEALGQPPD